MHIYGDIKENSAVGQLKNVVNKNVMIPSTSRFFVAVLFQGNWYSQLFGI